MLNINVFDVFRGMFTGNSTIGFNIQAFIFFIGSGIYVFLIYILAIILVVLPDINIDDYIFPLEFREYIKKRIDKTWFRLIFRSIILLLAVIFIIYILYICSVYNLHLQNS